jgi:hypothetical protein
MEKEKKLLRDQLELMAAKILTEGERLADEPMTVEYDHGGGQSGVRENPFFPAYEKLMSCYTKTLAALKSMAGEESAEVTNLNDIRARFKVAK